MSGGVLMESLRTDRLIAMRQERRGAASQAARVTDKRNALQSAANPLSLPVVHTLLLGTSSQSQGEASTHRFQCWDLLRYLSTRAF